MLTYFYTFLYSAFIPIKVLFRFLFVIPFCYIKRKVYCINTVKNGIFSTIEQMYGVNLNIDSYKWDVSMTPGFMLDGFVSRFATSQITTHDLWFKIDSTSINYFKNSLPTYLDLNNLLNPFLNKYNVSHSLLIGFKRGKIIGIRFNFKMKRYNLGMYLGDHYNAPTFINVSIYVDVLKGTPMSYRAEIIYPLEKKSYTNTLSLTDFFKMLKLECIDDPEVLKEINAILPELRIPSAYDFTSADFKDRLLLIEMLQF